MNRKLKTAIFIILLIILVIPAIQQKTGLIRVKGLYGRADTVRFPRFSFKTWFTDEFQVRFNRATDDNVGFRPLMILLKNQLEFSVYHKANASGAVVGQDGYLFESDYIRSFTGRDFLGDYYWDQKFNRLEQVRDTLGKLGVKLAIVLEPGKATCLSEYIPRRFTRFKSEQTNYRSILKKSAQRGIPCLDLNQYFRDIKSSAPFPLFPKGGIHWSTGGMVLAADTLLGYIRNVLHLQVPDLVIDRVEMTDSLRDTDGDLSNILNLIKAPVHPKMGYPVFHLAGNDTIQKPRVVVVSDSYYFNIMGANIPARVFANEAFWYYNQLIYPDTWLAPKDTGSLNIPQTVEAMDLVLIMVTERFYYRFDWDLTDILYNHYFPGASREYRYDFMRSIVRNYVWFDDIQQQSDYSGIPIQHRLEGNADYLFWQADQAGKIPHDIDFFRLIIMKDPLWMKQIREKALINKISVDEQIRRDAIWLIQQGNQ